MSDVVRNDHPWACDIDDTLLLWDVSINEPGVRTVDFVEPHGGQNVRVVVNENNLRLLLEKKARGAYIILWSQGGYQYCLAVLRALELEKDVDLVMTKPVGLIDDLPSSAWLPAPINIPYTKNYKRPFNP